MRIPNIMIGNSGVGKSTFVNKLFGKDISKVDSFCGGVTQSAQVIDIKSNDGKNDNVVCRIVDTKGIECIVRFFKINFLMSCTMGEEGKDSLRKICEKLKIPKDDEGYINAVFWLIDSTTSRVDVGIKDLWKLLTNRLEPRYVAFIITKCDLSDFSTIWKIRGVIEKMHKSMGLGGKNVNIHLYSSKKDKIYSEYPRYCNFGIHYRQNKKKKIMNEFKMNCLSIKESNCDEDDAVLQSKIEQAMATVRKGLQTGLTNGMKKHMIIDYDGEKGTIHCHECGKTESACRYGCQNCQIISISGTHKVKCSQCGKKWIRPCDSCDIWRILEDTIQNLRKFKSEGNIVEGVSQKEYYLKDIEEFERNVKIIEKEEEKEEQSSSFMDKAGEKFGNAAVKVYQSSTSFAIKGSVEVLKGVKRNSKEIREMLLLSFQVGAPMAIFGTKAILTLTKLILQARQRTSRREE